MNLYCGTAATELDHVQDGSVSLVYIDPPFYSQKTHTLASKKNEFYEFDDIWGNINEYLEFIEHLIVKCKNKLNDKGSLFLHCDRYASHYLRLVLDKIFGENNFRSEIIWSYKRWSNNKLGLLNTHQNIFYYTKSSEFTFNTIFSNYSETTNIDQILQLRERNGVGKSAYKKDKFGNAIQGDIKKGVPLGDVWEIPYLNPKANERVGYPTQKPIVLLERIIEMCSNVGDTVLDPCCGSGTTLVAAKLLKRNYIGIDASRKAIDLARKRLTTCVKTKSNLLENGKDAYNNKSSYERSIIDSIGGTIVQRNKGIDCFLGIKFDGKFVPVRIQKEGEPLIDAYSALKKASKSKKCEKMVLIRTAKTEIDNFLNDDNLLLIDAHKMVIDNYFAT